MRPGADESAMLVTSTVPAGTRLGDFVIELPLGSGGMGQVYRARQIGIDRPVAVKVLSPALAVDEDFVRRFQREARLMRDLEHPAILPVYAAGADEGRVYLAMRLVPGSTLHEALASGKVDADRAVRILRTVAEGLDHAHSRGVLHRDIKPGNILLDTDGRAFLADFGISRQIGSSTVTGHYLGTPRYMAPEQARGDSTTGHRADLYSLACVAFEVLVGSAPFTESDTVPLLVAHATRPVPAASSLDPSLSRAVDAVFARALAKQPADRFDSAVSFVDALAAALAEQVPVRLWPRWVHSATRRFGAVSRHGRWAAVVAILSVVTVIGTTLVFARSATHPQATEASAAAVATPTIAPFRPAPTRYADVARGDLVYAAALDGTPAGFIDSPATQADSAREAIRYVPGALELEAFAAQADTYTEIDGPGVSVFVGEMDLKVRPGSTGNLCWSLRWAVPRQLASYVCVDVHAGTAGFSTFRRGSGRSPVSAPASVPGLTAGQTVRLAVVVQPWQLSLYADGVLVQDVPNEQVPPAVTAPGIEFEDATGPALLRIEGLRLYDLGNG